MKRRMTVILLLVSICLAAGSAGNTVIAETIAAGDTVVFGRYEQDNNMENAIVSGAAEVQKYLIPTQSMMPSLDVTINKAKFDAMPAEYQELLKAVCKDLEKYDYDVTDQNEQSFHDRLINEYHLEECELTDDVRKQIKDAAAPAIDTVKKAVGNDAMYECIEKLIEE